MGCASSTPEGARLEHGAPPIENEKPQGKMQVERMEAAAVAESDSPGLSPSPVLTQKSEDSDSGYEFDWQLIRSLPPEVEPESSELGSFPVEGVSLSCLRSFREAHHALLTGLSVEQVCAKVVRPLSMESCGSITSCLRRLGARDPTTGKPFVSHANAFAGYSWKDGLLSLLDALESFASQQPDPGAVYFWLDLMTVTQQEPAEGPETSPPWWRKRFAEEVATSGLTCLVLSVGDAPAQIQQKCRWEIVCSLERGNSSSEIVVALEMALQVDFELLSRAAAAAAVMPENVGIGRESWSTRSMVWWSSRCRPWPGYKPERHSADELDALKSRASECCLSQAFIKKCMHACIYVGRGKDGTAAKNAKDHKNAEVSDNSDARMYAQNVPPSAVPLMLNEDSEKSMPSQKLDEYSEGLAT